MVKDQKFVVLDPNRPMISQVASGIEELRSKNLVSYAAVCSQKIYEAVERGAQEGYNVSEFETEHLRELVLAVDPCIPGLPASCYPASQNHPTHFGILYGINLYYQSNIAPALKLPDYSCTLYGRDK